jgi:hypothetical protein
MDLGIAFTGRVVAKAWWRKALGNASGTFAGGSQAFLTRLTCAVVAAPEANSAGDHLPIFHGITGCLGECAGGNGRGTWILGCGAQRTVCACKRLIDASCVGTPGADGRLFALQAAGRSAQDEGPRAG